MLRVETNGSGQRTAMCPQCRGRMLEDQIEVIHTHAGLQLKVRAVPAWVCRQCGKKLVTTEVAERVNVVLDKVAGPGKGRRIQ